MKVKLKLSESLTPTQVREVMKPFNNYTIDIPSMEISFVSLGPNYIALRTELQEDGYQIFMIHHKSHLPEF